MDEGKTREHESFLVLTRILRSEVDLEILDYSVHSFCLYLFLPVFLSYLRTTLNRALLEKMIVAQLHNILSVFMAH